MIGKSYLRLAIVFFVILLCVIFYIFYSKDTNEKSTFKLVEHVPERQVVGHLNILKLLNDGKKVNRELKLSGFIFYLNQVEEQLLNSGLKIESSYFTYSDKIGEAALYIEIDKKEKCDTFLKKFVNFYELEKEGASYTSSEERVGVHDFGNYLVFSWGVFSKTDKPVLSHNDFRNKSLINDNTFLINPQGKDSIHKSEFIKTSYLLDSTLSFTGDWIVGSGQPFASKRDTISVYPSAKKELFLAVNLDKTTFENYQNEWLKNKFEKWIQKLNINYNEFWSIWNGVMSLQHGGESTLEKVTITTEYDENFNQIEKKNITKTKVKDLGVILGCGSPTNMYSFIKAQKNVKIKGKELYFPLSPPLKKTFLEESLVLSSGLKDVLPKASDEIIKVEGIFSGFWFELNGHKTSKEKFNFQLEMGSSKEAIP
ncbi:MAG: hypothetical protein WED10_05410 [Brumimicrobium sp.]